VLVGTHHKTGSAWMRAVFGLACEAAGETMHCGPQRELPAECAVFLEDHSEFDLRALRRPYRGLHLIRDPRDIIVSGAFYHRTSTEAWLLEPARRFQGRTYQQAIRAFATDEEAFLFEMEWAGGQTIRDMLAWDYGNPRFIEARYEDLVQDEELEWFRRVFEFLGYQGERLEGMLRIAHENSLFSGKVASSGHVRSGRPRQWQGHFTPALGRRFLRLFGDALVRLGYEADDSWCP
jgi:hypothetical protein